jgi:hypothetical protein
MSRVKVVVTTPAKTVADCFRFRRYVGLDVALAALKDYRAKRKGSIDELVAAARGSNLRTHAAVRGSTCMKKSPKDTGASVRARLQRIATERGDDFQNVLTRSKPRMPPQP